jgi:hypothetical protein
MIFAATRITTAMPLYPYVYINADGTARELHAGERAYLETEFMGGDGAMPSIKDSYDERNGWGEIRGYLKRAALPPGTSIADAPAENPHRPLNREETIACCAPRASKSSRTVRLTDRARAGSLKANEARRGWPKQAGPSRSRE